MHLTLTFPTLSCGRFFTKSSVRSYCFGFNGKEKVDEVYGDANAYDFGARLYDPRLGRWLALDPLAGKYLYLSPYNFVGNSPVNSIDPDGKDIIVGVAWTTKPNSSGHMRIYVSTYKEVQIKVIENGKTVTKTYYEKTGVAVIENFPNGDRSATQITMKSIREAGGDLNERTTAFYVLDIDNGIDGSSFDNNLNPNLNTSQKYFEKSEIEKEQRILEDAKQRQDNPSLVYDHKDDCAIQNDCSSIVNDLLFESGTIDQEFNVTTANGYSFFTPNQIGLDLKARGYPEFIKNAEDYKQMTPNNAKKYIENQSKEQ